MSPQRESGQFVDRDRNSGKQALDSGQDVDGVGRRLPAVCFGAHGAQADLSFIRGDPLTDIRAAADVRQVMLAGRLRTIDDLLGPFSTTTDPAPTIAVATRVHDTTHWWHEPEWLHHHCCE